MEMIICVCENTIVKQREILLFTVMKPWPSFETAAIYSKKLNKFHNAIFIYFKKRLRQQKHIIIIIIIIIIIVFIILFDYDLPRLLCGMKWQTIQFKQ